MSKSSFQTFTFFLSEINRLNVNFADEVVWVVPSRISL